MDSRSHLTGIIDKRRSLRFVARAIDRAHTREHLAIVHVTFETTLMTLRTSLMIIFDVISLVSFNKMTVVFVNTQLPGLQASKVVAV